MNLSNGFNLLRLQTKRIGSNGKRPPTGILHKNTTTQITHQDHYESGREKRGEDVEYAREFFGDFGIFWQNLKKFDLDRHNLGTVFNRDPE
jgi:hypothetical protein